MPHRARGVSAGAKLLVQLVKPLFEHLAKRRDAFPVDPPGAVVGFDAFPRDLQVLPLVDFVDERVNLPRPCRVDPVRESPRPMMFGSFAQGTFHLTDVAHLTFCLFPTVFAGRLPRLTPPPFSGRVAFATLLVLLGRPTTPRTPFPPSLALIGSLPSVPPEGPESPPGVTLRSSVPCRPQTPWCGGLNENAFASIVQARPCPTFGRPVRPWSSLH